MVVDAPAVSRFARLALGLVLLAPLTLVSSGCKSKKNKPKALGKGAEDSRIRTNYEYSMVPEVGAAPTGVDAELWADVAYFPIEVTEIGMVPRVYSMLAWVETNMAYLDPVCEEVLDGVSRFYTSKLAPAHDTPQTLVFYGKIDRALVERCAKSMFGVLGLADQWAVQQHETTTIFGNGSTRHVLEWAKRGEEIVVVYDTDAGRIREFFEATKRLEHDASFVDLLVGVERDDAYAEVVGRNDFGSVMTTVPSSGFRGSFGFDPKQGMVGQFWMRFESGEEATRASAGLDALLAEFNAVGVGILVSDGVDEDRVALHIEPDWSFFAEPEAKLRPLLEIVARRAEAAGVEPPDVEAIVSFASAGGVGSPSAAAPDAAVPPSNPVE